MVLLWTLPPDSVLPRNTAASSDLPSADRADSFRPVRSHANTGASLAQPLAFSVRGRFLGGRRSRAPSWRSSHKPEPEFGERERERADGSDPDDELGEASARRERRWRPPSSMSRVRTSSFGAGRRAEAAGAAPDACGGPRRVGDLDSDRSSARIHLFVGEKNVARAGGGGGGIRAVSISSDGVAKETCLHRCCA